MFNEISFPSHQGLPYNNSPPAIDGFSELHPGLPPVHPTYATNPAVFWPLEAGYVGAPKFNYAGSGSAFPNATFRGVKENGQPFLDLAFDVRFDYSFDDWDRIIVILRPAYMPQTNSIADRRIDILPVYFPGPFAGGTGGGANAAPANARDLVAYNYKDDRPPQSILFYKRTMSASPKWQLISVANATVKVSSSQTAASPDAPARHWSVELRIPTTKLGAQGGGADWVDITNDFGLYVNLIRVCTSGPDCAAPLPILGTFFSSQFTWPFDPLSPATNLLTDQVMGEGLLEHDWDVASALTLGHAKLGGAASQGVKFQGGSSGIGVLSGGSVIGTLDMSFDGAPNQLVANLVNDHPANAASGVEALFRIANFGLGPYGNASQWAPTPDNQPGDNPAPAGAMAAGGGTAQALSQWNANSGDVTRYSGIWNDQCLWVELSGPAGAFLAESSVKRNLLVKQASETESAASIDGDVPDADHDGEGKIDYWLHSTAVRLEPFQYGQGDTVPDVSPDILRDVGRDVVRNVERDVVRDGDDRNANVPDKDSPFVPNTDPLLTGEAAASDKPAATFLWVNTGYWRTPYTLTMNGQRHSIWLNSGSFGSVIRHDLEEGQRPEDIGIRTALLGDDVVPTGTEGYSLHFKGTKRIWAVARAGTKEELERPFEPRHDPPEPVEKPDGGPGPGPGGGGGGGGGLGGCFNRTLAMLAVVAVAVATALRHRR
jgi:hypothetical protein